MNKKGFAVSGMIYAILVLFLILVFSILSILGSRKLTFDKLKKDVLTHLNNDNVYMGANKPLLYTNMVPIYYDSDNMVWRKANPLNSNNQWYDYGNKKWANAAVISPSIDKTTVTDKSSNNNTGTLYYGTYLSHDGAHFDGVDDEIIVANTASLDLGVNYSVGARFKVDEIEPGTHQIVTNIQTGGASLNVYNGNIRFGFYDVTNAKYKSIVSPNKIKEGVWYSAVGTYDGNTVKLYVNGELVVEDTIAVTYKVVTAPFALGTNPGNTGHGTTEWFKGAISDAFVIKETLNSDTINNYYSNSFNYQTNNNTIFYYNMQNAIDKSANGYHGVLENGVKITSDGMFFDGIDDAVRINETTNIDLGKNFTLATRMKVDNPNNNVVVFGNLEVAGTSIGINGGKIFFQIYNPATKSYVIVKQSGTAISNTWYSIVGTYDGSTMKLYINGKLDNSVSATIDYKASTAPFVLGRNPKAVGYNNNEIFGGTISNTLLTKTTLSADMISKYYSSEFIYKKNSADVVYYNFQNNYDTNDTIVYDDDIKLWYVWIPRYKYTIFNGNNESVSEQLINITFESGINRTGTVTCVNNDDGSETCTDNTYGGITNGTSTYTHPAFKFGNTELTGFWVGKFEVSGSTSAITVKPNVTSLRSQTVSSLFTAIQNVKTTYGINNADSHMMKNMEWGAVAYLKQSKYGLGATDIAINDSSSYYTGGGTSDAYKTNVAQSTTGNIYGVYDMSGGAWEYVMGNMKNSSNAFYSSNAGFTTAPDAKYYDSYKYDSSSKKTHARGKLGDATKETLATFGSNAGGWYSDYAYFPYASNSWFLRGGSCSRGANAGVFLFSNNGGTSNVDHSARAVLTAE
ncbi:MAG: LamG domain-containing protein [Candidatus Faecisoma sp.]|nr:LamG domain-containing protein [Candidatus Faecisoma sp.]